MSVENAAYYALFLAEYTDILLSFQWELALNYMYYEVTSWQLSTGT